MDRTRTKVQNYDSTVSESVSIWQIIFARIITENPANAILLHLFKKSLWTTANNTIILYLKKRSSKMFTQITYRTNLIKQLLCNQVTRVYIYIISFPSSADSDHVSFQIIPLPHFRGSNLHFQILHHSVVLHPFKQWQPNCDTCNVTSHYVSTLKVINHAVLLHIMLPLNDTQMEHLGLECIHTDMCYAFHRSKI